MAGGEAPDPEEAGGAGTNGKGPQGAGIGENGQGGTGTGGITNPDSAQGADGPDAMDGGLSANPNDAKEQGHGTGTADEDSPLQFVFAGDILLSDHVLNAYQKADVYKRQSQRGTVTWVWSPHPHLFYFKTNTVLFRNCGKSIGISSGDIRLP